MRNDALDELESIPSLTTDASDREDYGRAVAPEPAVRAPVQPAYGAPAAAPRGLGTGPLWALVGALLIAFAALGWWSLQQITQLSQQLVATQESFQQISEDAAGRIKDISGKVVATESSVTSESESLKLRVKQLENRLAELAKAQQSLAGQQGSQGKRIEQLGSELNSQSASLAKVDGKLQGVADVQTRLKAQQGDLAAFDGRLKGLAAELAALKQQGQSIGRLEQDLLVLRSELDNQAAQGSSTAEFDAFRAQTTRNITTLQSQIQGLQQQLNAPR